eukprot:359562-Chlamydomonas_euryale.AAC.2
MVLEQAQALGLEVALGLLSERLALVGLPRETRKKKNRARGQEGTPGRRDRGRVAASARGSAWVYGHL